MEQKKNYNLVIGISALVIIVLIIAFVGYLVSKPRPQVVQGEAEAELDDPQEIVVAETVYRQDFIDIFTIARDEA